MYVEPTKPCELEYVFAEDMPVPVELFRETPITMDFRGRVEAVVTLLKESARKDEFRWYTALKQSRKFWIKCSRMGLRKLARRIDNGRIDAAMERIYPMFAAMTY